MSKGKPLGICKTCGSEIVESVNDGVFRGGECNACEYARYESQPALEKACRTATEVLVPPPAMTSDRFLILASPRGDLTVRRADWFRIHPADHVRRWQVLTYVRKRAGVNLDRLLVAAYERLVRLYQL